MSNFSIFMSCQTLIVPDYMTYVGIDFIIFSLKSEIELGQCFGGSKLLVFLLSNWLLILSEIKEFLSLKPITFGIIIVSGIEELSDV